MSYDVSLLKGPHEPCITCGHSALTRGLEVFSSNHPSNTSSMWRKAGCDLLEFHGKPAVLLGRSLAAAIAKIENNPEEYVGMEPANGWGTVASTLKFLHEIRGACLLHPLTIVSVDS